MSKAKSSLSKTVLIDSPADALMYVKVYAGVDPDCGFEFEVIAHDGVSTVRFGSWGNDNHKEKLEKLREMHAAIGELIETVNHHIETTTTL